MKRAYNHYCNEMLSKDWHISLLSDGTHNRLLLIIGNRRTGETSKRRFTDFGKAWDSFNAAVEERRTVAA